MGFRRHMSFFPWILSIHIFMSVFGLWSVSIYTRTYNQMCLLIQSFVNVSIVALKDTHWTLDFEDLPIYLEIGLLIQSIIYFSTWVPKCIYHLFFWNRYTRSRGRQGSTHFKNGLNLESFPEKRLYKDRTVGMIDFQIPMKQSFSSYIGGPISSKKWK